MFREFSDNIARLTEDIFQVQAKHFLVFTFAQFHTLVRDLLSKLWVVNYTIKIIPCTGFLRKNQGLHREDVYYLTFSFRIGFRASKLTSS